MARLAAKKAAARVVIGMEILPFVWKVSSIVPRVRIVPVGRVFSIARRSRSESLIPDLTVEQNIWFRREPRTALRTVDRGELRRRTLDLLRKYDVPRLRPDQELRRLTLAEIAFMIGYSEMSAFYRAVRRWTGKTPREVRDSVVA